MDDEGPTPEQQSALYGALVAFQASVPTVSKDATNPHLRNKYATLESVIETVRPHLAAAGLGFAQPPVLADGMAGCDTVLFHRDGGRLTYRLMMPVGQARGVSDAQAVGIVLSYARRYSLLGILGLAVGDEDTDGGPPAGARPRVGATVERRCAQGVLRQARRSARQGWPHLRGGGWVVRAPRTATP